MSALYSAKQSCKEASLKEHLIRQTPSQVFLLQEAVTGILERQWKIHCIPCRKPNCWSEPIKFILTQSSLPVSRLAALSVELLQFYFVIIPSP